MSQKVRIIKVKNEYRKPKGTPDGGRFTKKPGGDTFDLDADYDTLDERISQAAPALDYRSRKAIIDALREPDALDYDMLDEHIAQAAPALDYRSRKAILHNIKRESK